MSTSYNFTHGSRIQRPRPPLDRVVPAASSDTFKSKRTKTDGHSLRNIYVAIYVNKIQLHARLSNTKTTPST